MICPKCQAEAVKKNGIVFGSQRYRCKVCGFQFIPNALHGRAVEDRATAIALCHLGVSKQRVAQILSTTPTTITRWFHEMPTTLPFRFRTKSIIRRIEESSLRSYLKDLYVQDKSDFLIARHTFPSRVEVDLILKHRRPPSDTPKHTLTVCAFGDSLLQGVVHDTQYDRYRILHENFVKLAAGGLNIRWKNYARHGFTVIEGEQSFLSHLAQVRKSDYILFSFGGNECNHDWDKISADPTAKHMPRLSLSDFREKYIHLIRLALKRNKTPILFSLPPVHAENFVHSICIGRNPANIMRFLKDDIHLPHRWHEMYNLEVFKIARDLDLPIIDITTCFLNQLDYGAYICDDGYHPNEKGHRLIATAIQDFYRRYFD